jgi:hypothetical protein
LVLFFHESTKYGASSNTLIFFEFSFELAVMAYKKNINQRCLRDTKMFSRMTADALSALSEIMPELSYV